MSGKLHLSNKSKETDKLKQNVQEQLQRLLQQLNDLKEEQANLDPEEFAEMEKDTLDQLKEFQESLKKMIAGDLSLADELGSVKLAIQAAISQAFSTPEVIKMFAKKEPKQLRERLEELKRDVKLGKLTREQATGQSVEILAALKKLGEQLSETELSFLDSNMSAQQADWQAASNDAVGESSQDSLLNLAKVNIQQAKSSN